MASRYPSLGLSITLILLASTCTAFADSTCYCRRSTGETVVVGDIACLKTNGGMQEARCGFVLNNTAWKLTGNPCPLAWHGRKQGRNTELATFLGHSRRMQQMHHRSYCGRLAWNDKRIPAWKGEAINQSRLSRAKRDQHRGTKGHGLLIGCPSPDSPIKGET